MRKNNLFFVCLILLQVLSGCAAKGLGIEKNYDMSKYPGRSIVIGKIKAKFENVLSQPTFTTFLLVDDLTREEIVRQRFSRGKHFFIALDAGEYNIEQLLLGYGIFGGLGDITDSVPVNKKFTVGTNEVIYIGKLETEYRLEDVAPSILQLGRINIFQWIIKQVRVSDEYDIAVKEFHKLYPDIKRDVRKNLLR